MKEIMNSLSNNEILIFAILIFIFGLVLLSYLLTLITSSNKKKKVEIKEETILDEKNNELEIMLDKMQKTLDEKEKIDTISHFEEEQEASAIISYQELLQAAKKDFPTMELASEKKNIEAIEPKLEVGTNEIEVISISEPNYEPTSISEKGLTSQIEDNKRFRNSVFISPIYGVDKNHNPYNETKLEDNYLSNIVDSKVSVDVEPIHYDELEYEKKQNEQFLEDLKKFRNSL